MNYRCQLCLSSLCLVLIQVRSSSLLLEKYRKKYLQNKGSILLSLQRIIAQK